MQSLVKFNSYLAKAEVSNVRVTASFRLRVGAWPYQAYGSEGQKCAVAGSAKQHELTTKLCLKAGGVDKIRFVAMMFRKMA